MNSRWEQSWETFFATYKKGIKTCVRSGFFKNGWNHPSEADVEDVAAKVFDAIYRDGEFIDLDFSKGLFRELLTVICQRKTVDFIRSGKKNQQNVSVNKEDSTLTDPALSYDQHQEVEGAAFFETFMEVLLTELQHEVSPQTLQIFERVKLLGEEPESVARDLQVKRGVVDNSILKAKQKCREIVEKAKLSKEFKLR